MAEYRSRVGEILGQQGRTNAWFIRQMGVSEALFYSVEAGRRRPTDAYRAKAARVLMLPEDVLFIPVELSHESKSPSTERAAS